MSEKRKVLILEDDPDKEFSIRINLTWLGAELDVDSTENIEDLRALTSNASQKYDVVFIDRKVKDSTGNKVTVTDEDVQTLRETSPNTVLVGASADYEFEDADFNIFVGKDTHSMSFPNIIAKAIESIKN